MRTVPRRTVALLVCIAIAAASVALVLPPTQHNGTMLTPPASFPLTFTCAQAVTNDAGRVCVRTEPGASLTIQISYCSHHVATSAALQGIVYADSKGTYEWEWQPHTTCKGTAIADVVARWHGIGVE